MILNIIKDYWFDYKWDMLNATSLSIQNFKMDIQACKLSINSFRFPNQGSFLNNCIEVLIRLHH